MRMTIRKKLLGGFLLVLALLIATGVLSIWKMNGMGQKNHEINEKWMPSMALLGDLNGDFSDIQRLLIKIMIETNPTEKDKLESFLNTAEENIDHALEAYEPLISSEEERKLFDNFVKNYETYMQKVPQILEAARINDVEKADNLHHEVDPFWVEGFNTISKLIEWNQQGADAVSDESVQLFESGVTFVIILSVLAAISGIVIALVISRMISNPILMMEKIAAQIASGDLTVDDIQVKNRDEIQDLATSFNLMARNLRALIQQVGSTAEQVAASAEELTASSEQTTEATEQVAATMQEVAIGVDKQVQSVGESSQTIHEMSAGVQQIANQAHLVSNTANQASEKAWEGGQVIKTAVQQMNLINQTVKGLGDVVKGLGERSIEIGKILEVITGIAAQTNLLALNAAIEAARAGEHGRGFAVVADEVRKLAEQSAGSAQQISQLISAIQEETNKAVQSMEAATKEVEEGIGVVSTAGQSFVHIQDSVKDVTVQIQEVSSAVQQMAAGTEQMVHSMKLITEVAENSAAGTQEVSAATEEQLASMEEISSSAASLSQMAEELQNLISKFKV